jgi:hypothetical protein
MKIAHTILVFIVLLLVACAEKPESKIVGQWAKIENPASKIEIFEDGTLVAFDETSPIRVNGKWKFLDDGRLKLEMSAMGMTIVETARISFDGDRMTSVTDTETEVFVRITDD